MFAPSSTRRRSSAMAAEQPAVKTKDADDQAIHADDGGDSKDSNCSSSRRQPLLFQGVVACLTGMSSALKNQYHETIEALGGSFTRDFHTSRNTHLIAETAKAKLVLNGTNQNSFTKTIYHSGTSSNTLVLNL